jgi:hypothetical protein
MSLDVELLEEELMLRDKLIRLGKKFGVLGKLVMNHRQNDHRVVIPTDAFLVINQVVEENDLLREYEPEQLARRLYIVGQCYEEKGDESELWPTLNSSFKKTGDGGECYGTIHGVKVAPAAIVYPYRNEMYYMSFEPKMIDKEVFRKKVEVFAKNKEI